MSGELTPNTQITQENVGLLKAGDALSSAHRLHIVKGATAKGIVTEHGRYTGEECRAAGFTYIGPDLGDGWIGWGGGPNPVPGMRIEIRHRNGLQSTATSGNRPADDWSQGFDHPLDIIAFRPALSPPAEGEVAWRPTHDELANCRAAIAEVRNGMRRIMGEKLPTGLTEVLIDADWMEKVCDHFTTPTPSPVDWNVVGPKLVEALIDLLADECDGDPIQRARAALAPTQPQSNGE